MEDDESEAKVSLVETDYIVGTYNNQIKTNIHNLHRNIFEWHNPFVSFCGLIVIPAIIWHFDVWMIPAFLLLFLTCQILKPLANANQEEEDGDEEIDNQVI